MVVSLCKSGLSDEMMLMTPEGANVCSILFILSCDPFGVVSVFRAFNYNYITPSGLIDPFL
jgi:hypothetical protein